MLWNLKKFYDAELVFEKLDMVTRVAEWLLQFYSDIFEPTYKLVLGQRASADQGLDHLNILDLRQECPEGLMG